MVNGMATEYARRPISVDDFHRMEDAGIFDPDERVELLDGELIAVPPMKPPHGGPMTSLNMLFVRRLGDRVDVRVGLPIILDTYSEPLPDFALVVSAGDGWSERHPEPPDVALLVEVAYSSRSFDLKRKAAAYSRGGISEYWVVDVKERRLVVHRDPGPDGYRLVQMFSPPGTVSPLAFPDESFDVEALLGARPAAR
jgi:Uma2 family endonuclease